MKFQPRDYAYHKDLGPCVVSKVFVEASVDFLQKTYHYYSRAMDEDTKKYVDDIVQKIHNNYKDSDKYKFTGYKIASVKGTTLTLPDKLMKPTGLGEELYE